MHTLLKARYSAALKATLGVIRRSTTRVVGQIQVHDNVVGYSAFLKGTAEEFRTSYLTPMAAKTMANFSSLPLAQGGLLHDLGRQLVMRQSVSEKIGSFCPRIRVVSPIDGGNTRADIVSGIPPGHRVQRPGR